VNNSSETSFGLNEEEKPEILQNNHETVFLGLAKIAFDDLSAYNRTTT
jgi:hypothetical protein